MYINEDKQPSTKDSKVGGEYTTVQRSFLFGYNAESGNKVHVSSKLPH